MLTNLHSPRKLRFALGTLAITCFCVLTATAQTALESRLVTAMRTAQFDGVIDYGPYAESCPGKTFCFMPARTTAVMPNVDVAIIQLDANGQMVDRADVMLTRDYPTGLIVPLDPNQGASSVRFRKWDIARFDGGTYSSSTGKQLTTKGWTNNPVFTTTDDIVAGRASAPYQFMAPYPASLFKLLIGFKVMRMVDAGLITLDSNYTYSPDKKTMETRTIRNWMDPMITYSDNHSAQAMVKMLHDKNQMTAMNQEFVDLGLGTLQVNGTSTTTGGNWLPGQIHVTAFDVARLLWIIDGGTGTFSEIRVSMKCFAPGICAA
jgi:Beta-lactamase enzyme family